MKKGMRIAFTKSEQIIGMVSGLFLSIILSTNLSGQNLHTLLGETWVSSNWQNSLLQTYTYDASGFTINLLSQSWDVPSLTWKNVSQSNYTNNADGTPNVVITQTWDGVSAWNNSTRTTYTYNASKKVLTAVTELWLVAIWQNATMQTNTYDANGFLTNNLSQTWDGISSWKNSVQINYTNNTDGTVNQKITQNWDGVSAWNNSARSTYTYNASKKVLTNISDNWVTSAWQQYSMETDTYDASVYLINSLYQLWDAGTTSWKNDTQGNFTNNTNGTPSVVIAQTWDGVSAWVNSNRLTYTYSTPTVTPELFSDKAFTVYPNPAGDFIKIESEDNLQGVKYTISDQTGKIVLAGRFDNEDATIDISSLKNGIYFLHFGEKLQHSGKIVKSMQKE